MCAASRVLSVTPTTYETDTSAATPERRRSSFTVFIVSLLAFFGAIAIWSAATPLLAAPDEPSQIVKAAAVAHGELTSVCYYVVGSTTSACDTNTSGAVGFENLPTFWALVRAPDSLDPPHSQICFKDKKQGVGVIPASCARSLNAPATPDEIAVGYNKSASTYQARYPPLYYEIVGLPTHFSGSTVDVYLMRLVSALLSALFLALALTAIVIYSANRLLIGGLVIATTPMVLFLAAVVNSSGLEITAAIAFWVGGVILVTEHLDAPPVGLVAITGLSAVILELVRPLSPFWLAISGVVLLMVCERHALVHALRRRSVQIALGLIAVFGVAAIWWIAAMHSTDLNLAANPGVPSSVSMTTILETAFRHNRYYLPDMVGVFGWFDTYAPGFSYVIWYVLVCGVVLAAALRSVRMAIVLGLFVIAILILPPLIEASHARIDGYTWSGRDLLPFAVGLPILAAAALGRGTAISARLSRRAIRFVVVAAAIAQLGAFYEALRRYAVGTNGPLFGFILHPSWHPAIGIVAALALELAAIVVLSLCYARAASMVGREMTSTDEFAQAS